MSTHTIRLHRVLRAKPEGVYRAFLEPDALARWLPPYGFLGTVHHLEPRVGGTHRMSFRNFTREDAEARIKAQATREMRLEMSDYVIDNSGDMAALDAEVERFWSWLAEQPQTPWPPPRRPKKTEPATTD